MVIPREIGNPCNVYINPNWLDDHPLPQGTNESLPYTPAHMTVGERRYPQVQVDQTACPGRIGNPNDPWIIPIPTSHEVFGLPGYLGGSSQDLDTWLITMVS